MSLPTNYTDDILDANVNTRRKYNMIQNGDGTVSFEDVTTYTEHGTELAAQDINNITTEINNHGTTIPQKVNKFSGTVSGNTYVTVDQIGYDTTHRKLGLKVNGSNTLIPFSGGATLIGEYSTVRTVDVSEVGATSVGQFIAVPSSSDSYKAPTTSSSSVSNYYGMGWINVYGYYVAPVLSFSNGQLTITPARVGSSGSSNHASAATSYKYMTTKVYYVGDIQQL